MRASLADKPSLDFANASGGADQCGVELLAIVPNASISDAQLYLGFGIALHFGTRGGKFLLAGTQEFVVAAEAALERGGLGSILILGQNLPGPALQTGNNCRPGKNVPVPEQFDGRCDHWSRL